MDKRKKLIRLFKAVQSSIQHSGLSVSPYTFFLNKYALALSGARPSSDKLVGITKEEFSKISREFDERLKPAFLKTLSLTEIISLPEEKVFHFTVPGNSPSAILLLSPCVVISKEQEQKNAIYCGYRSEKELLSPFSPQLHSFPFSRTSIPETALQSTLFDVIEKKESALLPSIQFDVITDEAVHSPFPSVEYLTAVKRFLKSTGLYFLFLKPKFLLSSLTRKEKLLLYDHFSLVNIVKNPASLLISLSGKDAHQPGFVEITDTVTQNKTTCESAQFFNPLLTFDDSISDEENSLLRKIESKAAHHTCGSCFDFFIGMFPEKGKPCIVEPLRRSSRFKPFIRSKELLPFSVPSVSKWIIPQKSCFFQIPPEEQFEKEKILLRYFSTRPVACTDVNGLYFLNDIAAILPKNTEEILLEYTEAYLNSPVLLFYYLLTFPHHNKFLKKNFIKIPFVKPKLYIQNIIKQEVLLLREMADKTGTHATEEYERHLKRLYNQLYQLFQITQSEKEIIEARVSRYFSSTSSDNSPK